MTDKEVNIRSVLFLVIGILLVLSLIICVYIVNSEKDMVPIDATVVEVKMDKDGTGKNDVTVMYDVDNKTYEYNFYYKDDVKLDDKVTIYYDQEDVRSVKPYKTSKLIFVCPILGLVLCVLGLFELFSKSKDKVVIDNVDTKIIGEDAKTQQLKIITNDEEVVDYVKTPEEEAEVPVKGLSDKVEDVVLEEKQNPSKELFEKTEEIVLDKTELNDISELIAFDNTELKEENKKEEISQIVAEKVIEKTEINEEKVDKNVEDIVNELDKSLEEEVKEIKKIEPVKVIPKDYYISGGNLVYEVTGKGIQEVKLKKIQKVVKTINSEDNIVKITLYTDEIICVLTSMKNIDLKTMANTIHNKMIVIDNNFKADVEYKEY